MSRCLKRKPTERANTKVLIELVKEGVGVNIRKIKS